MNYKKFALSLFLVIVLAASVLAEIPFSLNPSTVEFNKAINSTTLSVSNTGSGLINVTFQPPAEIKRGTKTVKFTFAPITLNNINNTTPKSTLVKMEGDIFDFPFGEYSTTANVTAMNSTETTSQQLTLKFRSGFCDNGPRGTNLSISKVEINNRGDGQDKDWELLDEIEIEVKVENKGDEDVDAIVKLGFFDDVGGDFANDFDYLPESEGDEEEIEIDINDKDDATVTYVFRVPPDLDVDDSYKLAVKVFDDDAGEDVSCADIIPGDKISEDINIDRKDDEDKSIFIWDFEFPNEVSCGETVSGSFTVSNVGGDDEDRIRVSVTNSKLNLNQAFEVSNFDKGDEKTFDISFLVPEGIQNERYKMVFLPEFNYKESSGLYLDKGDEVEHSINVIGCGVGGGPAPVTGRITVGADLESDAKAGEELIVSATITKAGNEKATVIIDADGYQSWAELESVSKKTLSLDAGKSEEVTFTFIVDDDASGAQTFEIQTTSNGKLETQEVEVNIESPKGFKLDLGGNKLIWIIGIINLALIILIIIVAVKLSQR